jgi:hypothetical protein
MRANPTWRSVPAGGGCTGGLQRSRHLDGQRRQGTVLDLMVGDATFEAIPTRRTRDLSYASTPLLTGVLRDVGRTAGSCERSRGGLRVFTTDLDWQRRLRHHAGD